MPQPAHLRPEIPSKPAAPEGPARPKVLRRPAQFARVSHQAEVLPIAPAKLELLAPEAAQATGSAPATPGWQEDSLFGAVLLALLIVINVAAVAFTQPRMGVETRKPATTETTSERPTIHTLDDKATDQ